jgi:hypothetical protein
MNYNLFMIKLQIAQINKQQEQNRLQYIESIKHGSK